MPCLLLWGSSAFWRSVRGPGSDSATGEVVSITDVPGGEVVCVRDDDSGRTRCGEVSESDTPGRFGSVEVGGCAYIEVARDAAIELEHRACSG